MKLAFTIALLATGIIGVALVLVVPRISAPPQVESLQQSQQATFAFDAEKAPGWWAGDNNWPAEYAPDKDAALVQRTAAQGSAEQPGTCFVMYFYYDGSLAPEAGLRRATERAAGDTTAPLKSIGPQTLLMKTFEGDKDFQLHQFEQIDAAKNSLVAGLEFGFVQLDHGYIEMRGYCEDVDQLASTVPVFGAMELTL